MRPDLVITVQPHGGGELVEVRTLRPDYPADLMQAQVVKLGQYLGSAATIEYIQRAADGSLAARFGVDGLIDEQGRRYRLAPIAKAFAGAPQPSTVNGIHIILVGQSGYENDIGRYRKPGAYEVEALRTGGAQLPMLEYRIRLLSQDPAMLDIPEKLPQPSRAQDGKPPQTSDTLYYVLVVVAAIAAGVLVYLALLRASARPS